MSGLATITLQFSDGEKALDRSEISVTTDRAGFTNILEMLVAEVARNHGGF